MAFFRDYVAKPVSYAALGLGVMLSGKLTWDYVAPSPILNGVYSSVQNKVVDKLGQATKQYPTPDGGVVEVRRFDESEARLLGGAVGGLAALVLAGAALGVAGSIVVTAGGRIRDRIRSWK